MTGYTRLWTLGLVALCAAAACSPPSPAGTAAPQSGTAPQPRPAGSGGASLLNKVWKQTAPTDVPLGSMYIFLPDGTLLQTSCTEVYRLSTWRLEHDRTLTITEEVSARYPAEFDLDGDRALRLRFRLGGEWQPWKTLQVAATPFVCPDLPR